MAKRVSAWLRPDGETVRLSPNRNAVRECAGRGIEHVNLVVVTARNPQLLSIRCDITHIGTTATRNRPGRDDIVVVGIDYADRPGPTSSAGDRVPAAIRHV